MGRNACSRTEAVSCASACGLLFVSTVYLILSYQGLRHCEASLLQREQDRRTLGEFAAYDPGGTGSNEAGTFFCPAARATLWLILAMHHFPTYRAHPTHRYLSDEVGAADNADQPALIKYR